MISHGGEVGRGPVGAWSVVAAPGGGGSRGHARGRAEPTGSRYKESGDEMKTQEATSCRKECKGGDNPRRESRESEGHPQEECGGGRAHERDTSDAGGFCAWPAGVCAWPAGLVCAWPAGVCAWPAG